ncbi:MFS transporter [Nonomuraea sp. MCN248]|uniref:MFS transporter n=1 Tax=Nonomuraea corallina TaxID=2989783 RepID=A0ABT4S6C8_9ACTN|nr:MFS transporter [Nonomuraea corallina]MDA0632749.1 MFS transporter [Nonomuraea corallina]
MAGLWRHGDFLKLWGGETVSQFGAQITVLALPLTGILTLDASAGELGVLTAMQFAPVLLITLFAGVWLDGNRKRPALITANVGRAVLLGAVPVLHLAGLLSMPVLYAVAFLTGLLTAVFDVAYVVYLPSLVPKDQLVQANSRLEATYSIASIGGPGAGGLLVQWLTAPVSIVVNAVTYLAAAISVAAIRHREPPPERPADRPSTWMEIKEGLATTLRDPLLRPLTIGSAWFNLFEQVILTLYLLYGVRELRLSTGLLGVILAIGSVGALAGSFLADRAGRVLGIGRTMVWTMILGSAALGLVPAAAGSPLAAGAVLAAGLFVYGLSMALFNVHSLSLRGAIVPPELLGRVTATYRFFVYGTIPVGGLLAGLMGERLGVRTAMAIAVAALLAGGVAFAATRIRSVGEEIFGRKETLCSAD